MAIATALLIGSIIASLASAGVAGYSAYKNYEAQEEANQTNVELTNQANAQNQYNIEHAHQIEMEDLKAAGLNPVLTATGGSGASLVPAQASRVNAPQTDLSGVSSALNSMSHLMLMSMLMDNRNAQNDLFRSNSKNIAEDRNSILRDRNDILRNRRHTINNYYNIGSRSQSSNVVSNANEIHRAAKNIKHTKAYKDMSPAEKKKFDKEWDDLFK